MGISQFQIFLISIPVLIIVGGQVATSFFVRSAVIWLNDFGVIVIVFGNLMWAVHFPTKENRISIGSAVKNFSMGGQKRFSSGMSRFTSNGSSSEFNKNRSSTRTSSSMPSLSSVSESRTTGGNVSKFSSSERMVMGLKSSKDLDNHSGPIGNTIDSNKIMTYASSELFFDDKIMKEIADEEEDNNEAVATTTTTPSPEK